MRRIVSCHDSKVLFHAATNRYSANDRSGRITLSLGEKDILAVP
jgi:hypothetical protein